jgi:hypothetical protein
MGRLVRIVFRGEVWKGERERKKEGMAGERGGWDGRRNGDSAILQIWKIC